MAEGNVDYVGQVFEDRYRILRLIGEGGMGSVYEAEHVVVGRRVAVKLLHPEMARDPQVMTRFYNEARAAGSIGNEHIIEVLDFGKNPAPYLVMEFLEGRSLSGLLQAEGPLQPSRACGLLLQVLAALDAAHAKEIVHRDLKPENIHIVPKDGREIVKVLDFGISKLKPIDPQSGRLTQTGTVLGTPYYMSPEQALGVKDLNHLTDIYSAGVILYECVTGRLPFQAENYNMLLVKIISEPAPPPRSIRPDVPEPLEHIILKAMAQDRPLRFQSAREFAAALQSFAAGRQTGVLAPLAAASDTAARIAAARSRILQGGTAVGAAAGTGSGRLAWDGTATGAETPARRSKAVPIAVGATLAAVALAAGLYFAFGRGSADQSPAPPPAPPQPPPAAAPATPPAPPAQAVPVAANDPSVDAIRLQVAVTPPEAKIFVDGVEAPGNPASLRFRRDGLTHLLRMTAPGYVEKTQMVDFSDDVTLEVALERPAASPDAGPASPPAVQGPRRPPVRPVARDAGGTTAAVAPPPPPPPAPPTPPPPPTMPTTQPGGFREVDLTPPTPTGPTVPPVEQNPYQK